jgi:hypothetical protein
MIVAVTLLAGSFGAANIAYAFPATPMEKAELAQLTPQVRSDVQARLGQGETVHGVLETMLLNRVSQDYATQRIVATDFQRGDLVIEGPNGQIRTVPFDVTTLLLRK